MQGPEGHGTLHCTPLYHRVSLPHHNQTLSPLAAASTACVRVGSSTDLCTLPGAAHLVGERQPHLDIPPKLAEGPGLVQCSKEHILRLDVSSNAIQLLPCIKLCCTRPFGLRFLQLRSPLHMSREGKTISTSARIKFPASHQGSHRFEDLILLLWCLPCISVHLPLYPPAHSRCAPGLCKLMHLSTSQKKQRK